MPAYVWCIVQLACALASIWAEASNLLCCSCKCVLIAWFTKQHDTATRIAHFVCLNMIVLMLTVIMIHAQLCLHSTFLVAFCDIF